MAWFDRFRWGRKSSAVTTLDLFREIYGGRTSAAGKTVNLQTALGVSTVFACARVIGNGMAQVPLKLMRLSPDGKTRMPATDHPLYDVLSSRPNPWQTSFEFRQLMSWHVELRGNFFAFKNAPAGVVRELIPLTGRMRLVPQTDMTVRYFYTPPPPLGTGEQEIPAEAIWHVRGPAWHNWVGLEFLEAARDALGLAMAIEESEATLHKNGVRPSGVYSVEDKLSETQFKALRDWIEAEHTGAGSGKPMILDRSGKWMSSQMTGADAQSVENRGMQIEEICRFMGVMPIMVGYSDKTATYASAEQMFLAHAVHTLSPRWTMYEQSIDANLLSDRDRKDGIYSDFCEEGMIRGSAKDTKDTILGYVNGGVLTPNEGRALLDRNPDSDPDSDKLRLPVNTVQDTAAADKLPPA